MSNTIKSRVEHLKLELSCVGDGMHNEYISILEKLPENATGHKVIDYVVRHKEHHWIFNSWDKWELKSLVAVANSKTKETYNKRVAKLADKMLHSGRYSHIFKKDKINDLLDNF